VFRKSLRPPRCRSVVNPIAHRTTTVLRNERDYILRMIAAAAAALGRLRQRIAAGAPAAEIVQAARDAQGELLGKDVALLRAVDPASAAQMLGDDQRLTVWVDLLRVEADALREAGRAAEANAIAQQADHLLKRRQRA